MVVAGMRIAISRKWGRYARLCRGRYQVSDPTPLFLKRVSRQVLFFHPDISITIQEINALFRAPFPPGFQWVGIGPNKFSHAGIF